MDADDLRRRNEARCDRILRASEPLRTDDLPWHTIHDHALAPQVLDTLVYMRDVEGFTDRDLVGLTAHRTTLGDPLIRRFLDVWRSEERGHAVAIGTFLDRYTRDGAPRRQAPPPATAQPHEHLISRVGGGVGRLVAAAHMTWGAANELLTLNGYRILARRCGHPLLRELLTRIAAQEARHYSFYLLQAEWRLATSRTTRAALRTVLDRRWTPVGIGDGYKSPSEFAAVLGYLGEGPDGRGTIDRMDRRFAALPGFQRLHIYRDAAATYAPLAA